MLMQYLAHGADQVPFRVTYLRYTRSPARRWEEPLDNPRSLLVTVSDVDDEHSRCTIQQDACPSTLIEPLSQLWDALARRLQG
jgi:hypothetical protein